RPVASGTRPGGAASRSLCSLSGARRRTGGRQRLPPRCGGPPRPRRRGVRLSRRHRWGGLGRHHGVSRCGDGATALPRRRRVRSRLGHGHRRRVDRGWGQRRSGGTAVTRAHPRAATADDIAPVGTLGVAVAVHRAPVPATVVARTAGPAAGGRFVPTAESLRADPTPTAAASTL